MNPRLASDFSDLSLAPGGRTLIEASAGTGKTWTISLLYLRLLLERGLGARQIVVATYTNAAAADLRARLRARLRWALHLASAKDGQAMVQTDKDEAAHWLRRRWADAAATRVQDSVCIEQAIGSLDQAPIGTLHSLCQRILTEYPLLAGAALAPVELVDGAAAAASVADDLWRRWQQGETDPELQALPDDMQRDTFFGLVRQLLQPGVSIEPAPPVPVLPATHANLLEKLASDDEVLRANSKLQRGWRSLANWLRAQTWPLPTDLLHNLESLNGNSPVLKAASSEPDVQLALQFSRDCLRTLSDIDRRMPRLPVAALEALRRQALSALQARLAHSRQLSFDALVAEVHALLHEPATATALSDAIYATWPAALVDEFQDTDPLQYGILDRIYRDVSGAVRGRLLLIGDPKQAIYRFRGGDIHTYQRAAASVQERLLLHVNQRSSTALVEACNAFFDDCGTQLSAHTDTVHYQPVRAAGKRDEQAYRTGTQGALPTPLQVHLLVPTADEGVDALRARALRACADHIAALLRDDRQRIGKRRLQPDDIAVLVPKNEQVEALRKLLQARAVPCVGNSRASVFAGEAARSLQIILHAVLHSDDLRFLRAALASRPFGLDYATLRALGDRPEQWQPWLQRFRNWRQLWASQGVQALVLALIEQIATDVLACVDGERLLTDLRHLGELLQDASEHRVGAEDLLLWLSEQRAGSSEGEAAEAAQLRIESDAQRVRLMTVHASKGLEFNLVYLPLMWDQLPRKATNLCLLSTAEGRVFASSPAAIDRDLREQQDENFRLLYVALTRAVHVCHLFALDPNRNIKKAPKTGDGEYLYSALDLMLRRRARTKKPKLAFGDGWPFTAEPSRPAAEHAAADPVALEARPLPTPPDTPLPARYSFSALVGAAHSAASEAEAAADETEVISVLDELSQHVDDDMPAHPQLLALAGMVGADFGNAVHAILERRDPALPLQAQTGLVHAQLLAHGVRDPTRSFDDAVHALSERLQAVLDTPLGGVDGPRLGNLPSPAMRAEMAFAFPLAGASLAALRTELSSLGEPDLVPARSERLHGLMSGKIDLVFAHAGRFHVLDYKSNWLGDRVIAYTGAALQTAMDAAGYRFQALLYTLALERYLRQRLPNYERSAHLGDSWYVFVRAVGLTPEAGVWRHRFSDAVLDAAQRAFAAGANA